MKKIVRVFSIVIVCSLCRVSIATNINSFKTLGLAFDKESIAPKVPLAQNQPNGDQNQNITEVDSKLPQINLPTIIPVPSPAPSLVPSPAPQAETARPAPASQAVSSPVSGPVPSLVPSPSSQAETASPAIRQNKKYQKTKGGNKKVAYHDSEFEKREIAFLFAPDDDVVDGRLTFDAYIDRMDYYEYIQLFKLNYISEEEKIKADRIKNYLNNYHDFKKRNK